jgi:hypothetical protein
MKSILDPTFKYTSSLNTDIRRTFARVRRESREAAIPPPQPAKSGLGKVASIVGRTGRLRARIA